MGSDVSDRCWLAVVHLLAIPTLIYLGRRRQWFWFSWILSSTLFSLFMHLCQIAPNYGLTGDNWCLLGSGTDVNTGLSLADYVFAYGILPVLSIYGLGVQESQKWATMFLTLSLNFTLISVYGSNKTPPLIVNSIIFSVNVIWRAWTIFREGKSREFFEQHINLPSLVIAIVLLIVAGIFYMLQSDDTYVPYHSTWMGVGFVAEFFAFHTFDPNPLWSTVTHCCRPVQFVPSEPRPTVHVEELRPLTAPSSHRFSTHSLLVPRIVV